MSKLIMDNSSTFFDDYVIVVDGVKKHTSPHPENLPRKALKECERSPLHAYACLYILGLTQPEIANEIKRKSEISEKDYDKILSLI